MYELRSTGTSSFRYPYFYCFAVFCLEMENMFNTVIDELVFLLLGYK